MVINLHGEARIAWYVRTTRINTIKVIKTMYGIMIICSTVADVL